MQDANELAWTPSCDNRSSQGVGGANHPARIPIAGREHQQWLQARREGDLVHVQRAFRGECAGNSRQTRGVLLRLL